MAPVGRRFYKKGRGYAAGCVEGLCIAFAQGATALRAEGDGGALRAQILKKRGTPSRHFDKALRSGEISPPSDGTGGITLGNLSTQSFIEAVPICPVPTCISARYDDVGEHPSRHFDRSGVEWRNLFL